MNVYDFDNTIYDGESSVDFFMFCLKKRPKLIKYIFVVFFNLAKYKLCLISKQELLKLAEKNLFGILDICPDYEKLAESFWDKSMNKIKPLYLDNKRKDDVIISASFDFLLKPCCRRLGVSNLLCSKADLKNGKITRLCFRENKPEIFDSVFGSAHIDNFYTDSANDLPMIKRAERSYLVKGNRLILVNRHGKTVSKTK